MFIPSKQFVTNNRTLETKHHTRYLGLHLNKCGIGKPKEAIFDIKIKQMYWFIGRKSKLAISNKRLLQRRVLAHLWRYGCQLWGCDSKTNITLIQRFPNKTPRMLVSAP